MELLADPDPEEARHLLDSELERIMAAVHRYDGMVNQVMGDGIMALFGAPLAYEDHPATRPGSCCSWVSARPVSRPQRLIPPPATTDRPLPSLRRWACAHFRLTATTALAPCMPSSADGGKRAPNSQLLLSWTGS
jgi:class 3 adenylate cyclase